jgi:hypothetical protein
MRLKMLAIKSHDLAKKITSNIFQKIKNKEIKTLLQFREELGKNLGFNSFKDAFSERKNESEIQFLKDNYISHIDDPRVTIDVARMIGEDYDKASEYFEKNLKEFDEEKILFPILSDNELLKRCEEILILFHEIEYFSIRNLILALYKIELPKSRIAYKDQTYGDYGNPELQMSLGILDMFQRMDLSDWVEFDKEDLDYNDGYSKFRQKIRLFSKGIIWTQSNVGSCYYSNAKKNSKVEIEKNKSRRKK